MSVLQCAQHSLDLSVTQVMGILNVTPDSFSDGASLYKNAKFNLALLESRAQSMIESGAAILDVGGESTRPGAQQVSIQEEMDRVLPVVEWLVRNTDTIISVDTSSAKLMTEAAALGVGMINDVRALQNEGALAAAAASGLAVCLMHMQGSPKTMQLAPAYENLVEQVSSYLLTRAKECEQAGIEKSKIVIDPGFGFGKTMEQNFKLLKETGDFVNSGYPVLIGTSRKSMFGQLLSAQVGERLAASLASVAYAVMHNAAIVRVHDVRETVDVVRVIQAIKNS